jgi:hypothetical protein
VVIKEIITILQLFGSSLVLSPEKEGQEGEDNADNDAGGQREVELEVPALIRDIAG